MSELERKRFCTERNVSKLSRPCAVQVFWTFVASIIEAPMMRVDMERLSGSLVDLESCRGDIDVDLMERLLQDGVAETGSGRGSFPVRRDVFVVGGIFRCVKEMVDESERRRRFCVMIL